MNFLSLNINGVADPNKQVWVHNLKSKLRCDFIGLQETHQAGMSEVDLSRFWDRSAMMTASVDLVGRSRGLVSIWDSGTFSADFIVKRQRFLVVSGTVLGSNGKLNILNLHAPNDLRSRRELWDEIVEIKGQMEGLWIMFGDFNDVRSEEERVNSRFDGASTAAFNGFIFCAGLLEFPMIGGMYTFISDNLDVKLSRLDRFLVCDTFISNWPHAKVEVHKRGHSDHCPLSLSCGFLDFGPTPFKFYNSGGGS
ncbi:putative RNA-directed DNA polymerase [Helianthus annuus]|nr:putative RNA-directed DNA polymerase [Helianthus annuus]